MITRNELIYKYYSEVCDATVIPIDSAVSLFKHILRRQRGNTVYVTSNKYFRKLLSMNGKTAVMRDTASKAAEEFYLQIQLYSNLREKNIPVYRFSRPDKLEISRYSPLAQQRIRDKLSFPKMSEDYTKYECHFKEIIGDRSSPEYISGLKKIPQVFYRGKQFGHEDAQTELVNIFGGLRKVVGAPNNPERVIHVYGRCGAFGYAVEDADTIPSLLQKHLNELNQNIAVVNHGIWGADDDLILNNLLIDCEKYTAKDVVIIYERAATKEETVQYEKCGVRCRSCTDVFHADSKSAYCFYDNPGHMSHEGYEIVASYIAKEIEKDNFKCEEQSNTALKIDRDYISEYLADIQKTQFNTELKKYLDNIKSKYPLTDNKRVGAIVMNCNPFTLGHRYLIEYASKQVDRLYVFVLQEDRSFFPFNDRYELVKKGTADLGNVIVLPSGEFMISTLTFPEYFMKEYKKSKEFDATKDLNVFANIIAPELHISVRFAGEEPLDVVTREYNANMRKILPEAGIEFIEIPRKTTDGFRIVSASKVRVLLKENEWDELKQYVPITTYQYLTEKFKKI